MNRYIRNRNAILAILLLIICEGINVQQVEYEGKNHIKIIP